MIEWITDILKRLIKDNFTGSIQINFSNGGIGNINKQEKLEPPKKISVAQKPDYISLGEVK